MRVCSLKVQMVKETQVERHRRVYIVEQQVYVIMALNGLLYLLGFLMYVAASNQQTAQYVLPIETWLALTYVADFISILATAWLAVLFEHRDLLEESRFGERAFMNGLFTLLFVSSTIYVVLSTNITFIYMYASQDKQFLDLLNKGFQVTGSYSFIELRYNDFMNTIIWNNAVPSILVLMLYFVQSTIKHYIKTDADPTVVTRLWPPRT